MTDDTLDIEIEGVSHAYHGPSGRLPVLRELSLAAERGGFIAVVGPSGCGKSTLTKLVAGLMRPDAGVVRVHGVAVTGPRPNVGMAFQNPVLLEWRNIRDNVLLPLEIVPTKLNRSERQNRAHALLALVGLEGFEEKRPSELSGGMRQRASLCRALVHQPDVLILDEPFGALDAFTREDLWSTMRELRRQQRFTGLLITHDLREAVFLADQVFVLSSRPATVQQRFRVDLPAERTLTDLYSPEATQLLAALREEIEIAQGRRSRADQGVDGAVATVPNVARSA